MKKSSKIFLSVVVGLMIALIVFIFIEAHGEIGVPFQTDTGRTIIALLSMMSIDFIVGLANAMFFKKSKKTEHGGLSSKIGTEGLIKKILILILILSIHILEKKAGVLDDFPFFFITVTASFTLMEFVSILENLILMGIPFPRQLKAMFEVMREKHSDEEEEGEEEKKEE